VIEGIRNVSLDLRRSVADAVAYDIQGDFVKLVNEDNYELGLKRTTATGGFPSEFLMYEGNRPGQWGVLERGTLGTLNVKSGLFPQAHHLFVKNRV